MRFRYQYRTSGNEVRRGEVRAPDREAAFAALKARGIRPSRVDEAPGFFNKLFGRGKRWLAIGALSLALAAAVASALRWRGEAQELAAGADESRSSPRHQIYGDPAALAEMEASGYAAVFSHPGERLLARYALPGADVPAVAPSRQAAADLAGCLTNEVAFGEGDSREARELKAIVNGMKDELREYLSDGVGDASGYLRRLEERQEEERMIYRRVRNELEANPDPALREERNRSLRAMGIRTIPRPRTPAVLGP